MKRYVLPILKFGLPVVIIVFLVSRIDDATWRSLRTPHDWRLLAAAFGVALSAVCLTFIRWFLLVRALDVPLSLKEAFRLGFLTYLLNFVSVGSVGGDLFKAFLLAHQRPGRRPEAVATVIVDRVVGLYALLVTTALAIGIIDVAQPSGELNAVYKLTYVGMAVGTAAAAIVLLPGFATGALPELLAGLPKVGPLFRRLIVAVRLYRDRLPTVFGCILLSMLVHALLAFAVFLAGHGLFRGAPTLAEHFVIVPLSNVAGALPLTPAGLGTFEAAMHYLYERVPRSVSQAVSGVTVALVFRAITILIAAVGIIIYWTSRGEVREVMHEVEEAEERLESGVEG